MNRTATKYFSAILSASMIFGSLFTCGGTLPTLAKEQNSTEEKAQKKKLTPEEIRSLKEKAPETVTSTPEGRTLKWKSTKDLQYILYFKADEMLNSGHVLTGLEAEPRIIEPVSSSRKLPGCYITDSAGWQMKGWKTSKGDVLPLESEVRNGFAKTLKGETVDLLDLADQDHKITLQAYFEPAEFKKEDQNYSSQISVTAGEGGHVIIHADTKDHQQGNSFTLNVLPSNASALIQADDGYVIQSVHVDGLDESVSAGTRKISIDLYPQSGQALRVDALFAKAPDPSAYGTLRLSNARSEADIQKQFSDFDLTAAKYAVYADKDCRKEMGRLDFQTPLSLPAGNYFIRQEKPAACGLVDLTAHPIAIENGKEQVFQTNENVMGGLKGSIASHEYDFGVTGNSGHDLSRKNNVKVQAAETIMPTSDWAAKYPEKSFQKYLGTVGESATMPLFASNDHMDFVPEGLESSYTYDSPDRTLASILYYGYGGPCNLLEKAGLDEDMQYVITQECVAYALGGKEGVITADPEYDSLFDQEIHDKWYGKLTEHKDQVPHTYSTLVFSTKEKEPSKKARSARAARGYSGSRNNPFANLVMGYYQTGNSLWCVIAPNATGPDGNTGQMLFTEMSSSSQQTPGNSYWPENEFNQPGTNLGNPPWLSSGEWGNVQSYIYASASAPQYPIYYMNNWFSGANQCSTFDGGNFNMSQCQGLQSTFSGGSINSFINLGNWDVSSVVDFSFMFYNNGTNSIDPNISNWNTSSVGTGSNINSTNGDPGSMSAMFNDCESLETALNLNSWDVSSCPSFNTMFAMCNNIPSLQVDQWDTSGVTGQYDDQGFGNVFSNCWQLDTLGDVNSWAVSQYSGSMQGMFTCLIGIDSLDLSSWDTSSVQDFRAMFQNDTALTSLNIQNFNTGNVNPDNSSFTGSQQAMFDQTWNLYTIVTGPGFSFNGQGNLSSQSNFAIWMTPANDSVTNGYQGTTGYNGQFGAADNFTGMWYRINPSSPDYPNEPEALQTAYDNNYSSYAGTWTWQRKPAELNISKLITAPAAGQKFTINLTLGNTGPDNYSANLPLYENSLPDQEGLNENFAAAPVPEVNAKFVPSQKAYDFVAKRALEVHQENEAKRRERNLYALADSTQDTAVWATLNGTELVIGSGDNPQATWNGVSGEAPWGTDITSVSFSGNPAPSSTAGWFRGCTSLNQFDSSGLDLSNCQSMESMFENCTSLSSISLSGVANRVTSMAYMFSGCTNLNSIDMTGLHTSINLTNMEYAFNQCSSLSELLIPDMILTGVQNGQWCFAQTPALQTIRFPHLTFTSLVNGSHMYYQCAANDQKNSGMTEHYNHLVNGEAMYAESGYTGVGMVYMVCNELQNAQSMFAGCTFEVNPGLGPQTFECLSNCNYMFANINQMEHLNLRALNNLNATTEGMFDGDTTLWDIELGQTFAFNGCVLPDPPNNSQYTGGWFNTAQYPKPNEYTQPTFYTSQQLSSQYSSSMAGDYVWSSYPYTILFDGNGGTGSQNEQVLILYQNETGASPANEFSREGYAFSGWNTAADGSGQHFLPGMTLLNLTDDPANNATITFYAQWRKVAQWVQITDNQATFEIPGNFSGTLMLPSGFTYALSESCPEGWQQVSSTNVGGTLNWQQPQSASFTNSPAVSGPSITFRALKTMDGQPAQTGAFKFTLTETSPQNQVIQTVANMSDGHIVFDPVSYSQAGTYHYTITEADMSNPDIDYDSSNVLYATVNVNYDPNTGNLNPVVTYRGNSTFENKTKPGSMSVRKQITAGGNPVQVHSPDRFSFSAYFYTEQGQPISSVRYSVNNGPSQPLVGNAFTMCADDTVTFLDLPGGATYNLVEFVAPPFSNANAEQEGTVVGGKTTVQTFVNDFSGTGSASLNIKKQYVGGSLSHTTFYFDATSSKTGQSMPMHSLPDGRIVFEDGTDTIPITTEDLGHPWTISIRERPGDEDLPIDYDPEEIVATITPTLGADWKLGATITYTKGGKPTDDPAFVNSNSLKLPEAGAGGYTFIGALLGVNLGAVYLILRKRNAGRISR